MNTLFASYQKAARTIALSALLVPICLSTQAAGGHDRKDRLHPGSAATAEVQFTGTVNGESTFHVSYTNTTGSKFIIYVLDGEGNTLYQEVLSDLRYDRNFRVPNPENFSKLTFVIRNYGDNSRQRFEVNSQLRFVEETEVKEVK